MTIRARFDGRVFVPLGPVELPNDQVVELEVREQTVPPKGSPAAILQALRDMPPLEPGDIEALERSIEEGKLPVRNAGMFDDLRQE